MNLPLLIILVFIMFKSYLIRFFFILTIVGGLAVLFYLPYNAVKQRTLDSYNSEQLFLARQAAKGIENTLSMYRRAMQYYSSQPSIIHLDNQGARMLFDFYAIHKPFLVSVARLDSDGAVHHRLSSDAYLTDEVLLHTYEAVAGQNEELVEINTPDCTLIALNLPVTQNGEPDGRLVFVISFQKLIDKFLSPLKSASAKRLWILDQHGLVIECPNPAHKGAHITETAMEIDQRSSLLQFMQKRVREGYGEGSLQVFDNTSEKEPLLHHVVFMPILMPGGSFWSIAYTTPENIVLRNMRTFRNYWLLVSSIALIALLLLSYFLCRSMGVVQEEKKRREGENQLLELMDFTPIGIIVYDGQGDLKYANNTVRTMWLRGLPIEPGAFNIFDHVHPEDVEITRQRFKRVMEGKTTRPHVIRLLLPDGSERSVETSAAPFNFSGERCGVTVLQDVTQRLKDEEEQRRLATAVANTNDSIVITDRDGHIEYVNPAFTRITGYLREEVIGRNPRILKSQYHDEKFYRDMWDKLTRGLVWEGRLVNKKKDGSIFTEMASISPIRDSKGNITHFIAVKRDITHEVQLETQLHQAQKMEAIGTLAGGIAHDFNNILGAIIGFTDISLLQTSADSPVYDNLRQIKSSGQRAADLVQQILTFSRMAVQRNKNLVCLPPLVKETMKLLRASIPTTIDIELDLHEDDVWVWADPVQIQQIIMNLSSNAAHAMRNKGGTLTVTLRKAAPEKCSELGAVSSCLELSIVDTGHGIDPNILDRIYDPFFTTKEPGVGTGMGLSVVHGIVQELEGNISVDSKPEGTCFTLLLPEAEPPSQQIEEELTTVPTGSESILVVDDEETILETSRKMLEQLGYRVTTTDSPFKALELLQDQKNHFDLVITDQTMPELTGIELLQRIQQDFPTLPVILSTGFSDQVNEENATSQGAAMYLMKPVNFRLLAGTVRQVLDRENKLPSSS